MKIAIFLPDLSGGGAEQVLLMLSREFVSEGHSIDMILARAKGEFIEKIPDCVNVIIFNKNTSSFPSALFGLISLFSLVKYLRNNKPDCLLSSLTGANVIAILASILCKPKKLVLREANTISNLAGRYPVSLIKLLYRRADHVIAISKGVADDLCNHLKVPAEKTTVIYNPINIDYVRELSLQDPEHPWFSSSQCPPVILGCGRLTEQKDFSTLIKAFSLVLKKMDARLIILGEGSQRLALESLISSLGLLNTVSLPGFIKNPYCYMTRSHVFVLSSRWEGLGNVLIESLMLGTPVVSTDCPSGPAEILEDGKFGHLVPVNNAEEMAEAIIAVLENKGSRKALTKGSKFSLLNITSQYLELMNR